MMDDLLKALMSGAGSQQPSGQTGEDPLADLLGGILGGGEQGAGGLGDVLSGFLGEGGQPKPAPGAGNVDDALGAILGGDSGNVGANAFLAPIVDTLSERLGLSPAIAQTVVAFAVTKLLSSVMGHGAASGSGQQAPAKLAGQPDLDLDRLLQQMGSDAGLDPAYLRSTGMPQELSQHTGMDPNVATESLQQVFQMLGGSLGGSQG